MSTTLIRTVVVLAISTAGASAATFVVNSTGGERDVAPGDGACETTVPGECTLRAAIDEANGNAEEDRIELPAGVFPGGRSISGRVHVVGSGPDATIIDGRGAGPVLQVGGAGSLGLFDLTLTNGLTQSGAGGLDSRGSLALANVHVTHCTGQTGGIQTTGMTSLTDVVVERCTGRRLAGGLQTTSRVGATLQRCRFSDNIGSGLVAENAGIASPVLIRDCTFERNLSFTSGGALQAYSSSLDVMDTTMTGNEATLGGALFATSWHRGSLSLTNCTISGNVAEQEGGGLHVASNLPLSARNTTIIHNRAARGGGLVVTGEMHLDDVIVFGNEAAQAPDCVGVISGSGNLVGDVSGCDPQAFVVQAQDDPLLGPLADNGGPTFTHALLPGSPAIDAGQSQGPAEDQRGSPRPSGEASDLGAYELDQTLDTDGDGLPDITDNCVDLTNESQLDADGDGWGDECDCAPSDAGAFDAPEDVTLFLTRGGGVLLAWSDVSAQSGPGLSHDISTDTIASLRESGVADATCIESGWTGTTWLDTDAPAVGDVYYLVRAANACGPGAGEGWGVDSLGDQRPACP